MVEEVACLWAVEEILPSAGDNMWSAHPVAIAEPDGEGYKAGKHRQLQVID